MIIRIYTDDFLRSSSLKNKLKSIGLHDVDAISDGDFEYALRQIKYRQSNYRVLGNWRNNGSNMLDDVSILFIDYDLFENKMFMDAERVSYLIRSFTNCGIIVILDKYGKNPFFLEHNSIMDSFADIHLGSNQMTNKYLWGMDDEDEEEFAPWYWPNLIELAKDYKKRINDVKRAIHDNISIWRTLGFTKEMYYAIPKRLLYYFGSDSYELGFDEFGEYCLKLKDRVQTEDINMLARVAASRLYKWLEYQLLPEMSVLIDAPHLVMRLPKLATAYDFNSVVVKHTMNITNLRHNEIDMFRFKELWLSRPAWLWLEILESDILDETIISDRDLFGFVFCEDVSHFRQSEECIEYWIDTVSPYSNRFIKSFDDVDYIPHMILGG